MESNNRIPMEPQPDQPTNNTDAGDWRSEFPIHARRRIIMKIMETLKRHLPISGDQALVGVNNIAVGFEDRHYKAASSQKEYLKKISMKLLSLENNSQNAAIAGSFATNPASSSGNPTEPAPQNMQVQGHNQGQAIPMPQPQACQQILAQNLPTNIASVGVTTSAGLAPIMPPVSCMNQSPISNVISQTSITQSIADTSQNVVGNAMGQGVASNVFNNEKQVPGRQQALLGQDQFQQQYMRQQQSQQQFIMQKQLQQGIIPNSLMQSHIQQKQHQQQQPQNLPQQNHIQSTQQAGISTSNAMLQQQPQSAVRQQQQQQQQQMLHQSTVSSLPHQQLQTSQPQQPLMGQHTNTKDMQPTQLLGQQSMSDMLQKPQRLMTQQNNILNVQQQQQLMYQQTNLTNMHQQHMGHEGNNSGQQHQHGTQSSSSNIGNQHKMHMAHHGKGSVLQQNQQPVTSLLENQEQHSQPSQTEVMSQIQSQPAQFQHQLGMTQQHRDMQQRLHPSGTLMQHHNNGDQLKQIYQSQRLQPEASSTSTDSVSQTGHSNSANWQEEVYKKITSLKESYFLELSNFHQKFSLKLAQYPRQHGTLSPQPNTDQLEKVKAYKLAVEKVMAFLQVSKSSISPAHRERLPLCEKQIINIVNSFRGRRPGHVAPPMQSVQQAQRPNMPAQSRENQMNPSNIQGPVMMQQNRTSFQQIPISPLSGTSNIQQNMSGSLQPGPNVDAGQDGGSASLQQGVGGPLLQNSVNAHQQIDMKALASHNEVNLIQPNTSNLQSNSSVNQHVKERQMMQSQQLKHQLQQRQMQQQVIQQQKLLQHQQSKQQQAGQMSAHQLYQLQQVADVNGMNIRQGLGVKPSVNATTAGQHDCNRQLIQSRVSFPMSSPQNVQTSSPQILLNPSPQVDKQHMPSSLSNLANPPAANSLFVAPSPSTPLAPCHMAGDSEKLISTVLPLTTPGNIGVEQKAPPQSMPIGTPGISASPLLAEFSNQDVTHGTTSVVVANSSITNQPLDRLIKAVKSISNEAFTASVNDIGSVLNMTDRISGSAPGNGSRAAVGEDMVAMTKCRLQVGKFPTQDGIYGTKKMKRFTSSMPLIVTSTHSSGIDSFKQLVGSELSDFESTATSRAKRPRIEATHSLLKEIREINQRLIDTMVDISDEDVNPSAAAAAASECGDGVIVKCSYNAVALSPDLKTQYATAQLCPIQPLRLLVPSNYPNSSPVLLDKVPAMVSNENEDLSMKAKSKFNLSLRTLPDPMSLGEIARTWDFCARTVICEYAQARGGGSFSSRYGTWESVLTN